MLTHKNTKAMVDLTNNKILTQICLTKIFLSFYKIKALTNNCLLITYLHLLIIDDNSSCRIKKHIYTSLQWFLKNLKSEVLLLSKRGSHSCFYRNRWNRCHLEIEYFAVQIMWLVSVRQNNQEQLKITITLQDKNQPTDFQSKSLD